MFHVALERALPFPASTVWSHLVDFPNVPTWEDGVLEVRQTSPGAPGIGTDLVARRVYAGRESPVDCRIVDWQEGRSVTMIIQGGPVRSASVCYAVEPVDDRHSVVSYTSDVTLRRPLGLLTPLIAMIGRRLVAANLRRLEGRIATGSAAPTG
jgi:hypothetical protein